MSAVLLRLGLIVLILFAGNRGMLLRPTTPPVRDPNEVHTKGVDKWQAKRIYVGNIPDACPWVSTILTEYLLSFEIQCLWKMWYSNEPDHYYTPAQQSCWGVYWFHTVRLSFPHPVSAL